MGVNRVRRTLPTKSARANGTGVGHTVVAMRGVMAMTYSNVRRRRHRLRSPSARTALEVRVERGQNVVLKRRFLMNACGPGIRGRGI